VFCSLCLQNLVDKICRLSAGRRRLTAREPGQGQGASAGGMMVSLLKILRNGTPRSQVRETFIFVRRFSCSVRFARFASFHR
jgi:hypothetical protein